MKRHSPHGTPQRGAALFALLAVLSTAAAPAHAADTFDVGAREIDDLKAVYATVRSTDEVAARVRTGGTVASLSIQRGSEVKTGDVIATVTDQKLALRIKSLDAQIVGLRSRAETAKAEAARQEQLAQRGFAAGAKLDEARAVSEVAANALKSAEAERSVLMKQVEEGEVLAPAQGRVLTLPVTVGAVVMPGETIAKIAANAYVLRLELPERHARFMKKGDPVLVGGRELSGDDLPTAKGTITLVYPELQDGRVIADAAADGLGKYFVGERVLTWISAGKRPSIVVPPAFLFRRFGLDYARVAHGDGAVDVVVQPGHRALLDSGGEGVEVLAGLNPGDRLVRP
ncbi:RND transporter [Rhodomicrobium udaipurense JA643]|uniref:Efflux RND transporter periplasmic adaptor subunit n=1 Tax=Rhodomicrobium udaipurense TaxID=1202716 RepID=A0A8I1KLL4_9HYPH|nr:efflux RND transporter periplasmic adaptor subunit [Rhodomicrobium udaipurense]KAI95795.1 RND transporter [Rhodomicrobium udaipurense JA643]MBJ7543643.1 efflux RND transporter periplasmic adaptor subunit [Rhodomicrobium udaipurense]